MTQSSLPTLLFAFVLAPVAFAATERPADPPPGPVLMAAADASVPLVRPAVSEVDAKPTSAGVADSLPDVPAAQTDALLHRSLALLLSTAAKNFRTNVVDAPLPAHAAVSTLQAGPLRGAAKMVHADRFNTDDGSSADDFAICYRLNRRSSVQVIPGDPAPVKIPVSSMSNNTGVTVGLVLRLSNVR